MSPESVQRFRDKDMRKNQRPTARRVNPSSRDVLWEWIAADIDVERNTVKWRPAILEDFSRFSNMQATPFRFPCGKQAGCSKRR